MGQINIDSAFGKLLYELGTCNEYKTYVEVGTWNGQGSTKCLLSGIVEKNKDAKLYSLEANANMYAMAKLYWMNSPSQLHLLYGVLHKNQMSLEQIEKHPMYEKLLFNGDKYKTWLVNDINDMEQTNIVTIPEESIDVIVLDGGEFSTVYDWSVLKKKNPKVVCLDDSNVLKTYDIRKELQESEEWITVEDQPMDRNGWCIFKRKK